MPRRIRQDDLLLRVLKDLNDVRSALRRVVTALPLFDIDNENTPNALSGVNNNYNPGSYDVLRLSSTSIASITGVRRGMKGRKLRLFNVGDYSILIPHNSFSSDAENRFKLQGGKNPVYLTSVEPNTNMQFYYDATQQRWLTVAAPPEYDIGEDWEAVTAPVFTYDVCWSEDLQLFVAVGTNTCMTSPDGETWTERTIPTGNWKGVKWVSSLNLFVAVSSQETDMIVTSLDGITWTKSINSYTVSDSKINAFDVCYAPELDLFCAVGSATGTGDFATSPDGETWTQRTAPYTDTTWTGVCWSSSLTLFVAVGYDTLGRVATSPDGVTWTARTPSSTTPYWTGVCWSEDLTLFVAVAQLGAAQQVMTSPDGVTWTGRNAAEADGWRRVTWSSDLGLFCAVKASKAMTSPDGTTWTLRTIGGAGTDIEWSAGLGLFCTVGSTKIYTSPDGTNWTERSYISTGANNLSGISWSPELSLFVAVDAGTHYIFSSEDGINWNSHYLTSTEYGTEICWSAELGLFCIIYFTTNKAIIFDSLYNLPRYGNSVCDNGSILVSVGISTCYTSTDGTDWTQRTIPAGTYNDVYWSDEEGLFVAVGDTNVCATSPDGITWTSRTIPNGDWNGVTYAPELGLFIACSDATNYIATSPDGITWTARTAAAGTWKELVWCPEISLILVIGTDNSLVSFDGINWIEATTAISGTWEGIAWSPDLILAVAVASAGANKAMKVP